MENGFQSLNAFSKIYRHCPHCNGLAARPKKKAGGFRGGGTPPGYKSAPLLERPLRSQLVGWLSSSNIVFCSVGWFQGAWESGILFCHFSSIFASWFRTSIFVESYCILAVNMGPTWAHFRNPERSGMPSKIDTDSVALSEAS